MTHDDSAGVRYFHSRCARPDIYLRHACRAKRQCAMDSTAWLAIESIIPDALASVFRSDSGARMPAPTSHRRRLEPNALTKLSASRETSSQPICMSRSLGAHRTCGGSTQEGPSMPCYDLFKLLPCLVSSLEHRELPHVRGTFGQVCEEEKRASSLWPLV